jgi:hypothetical protein
MGPHLGLRLQVKGLVRLPRRPAPRAPRQHQRSPLEELGPHELHEDLGAHLDLAARHGAGPGPAAALELPLALQLVEGPPEQARVVGEAGEREAVEAGERGPLGRGDGALGAEGPEELRRDLVHGRVDGAAHQLELVRRDRVGHGADRQDIDPLPVPLVGEGPARVQVEVLPPLRRHQDPHGLKRSQRREGRALQIGADLLELVHRRRRRPFSRHDRPGRG